jgi:hypothetical protein
MMRGRLGGVHYLLLALLIVAGRVQAQSEAGAVAALVGTLQIQRGAAGWQSASIGVPVFVGDRFRTGASDRATLVFRDDTVLNLSSDTEAMLDTQAFDEAAGRFQTGVKMTKGKIRAWVGDHYRQPRARFEIETPTAITDVRGTQFIVQHNPKTETSDIVGIADEVEVIGKLGVIGSSVQVGQQMHTRVQKGRFPTAAQGLDETQFSQYLDGTEIVGTGRHDGLNVVHPAVMGRLLSPQDAPASLGIPGMPAAAAQAGVGAPELPLAYRLSPDVYANTQPLLDFKRTPPGRLPSGAVHVGF